MFLKLKVIFFQTCSLFAKALTEAAGHFYPFWPYCAIIVLYGTRLCQCPERFLERASDHMDCFRNNYRYSFTFCRKPSIKLNQTRRNLGT